MNIFEEKNQLEETVNSDVVTPVDESAVSLEAKNTETLSLDRDKEEAYKAFLEKMTIHFVVSEISDASRAAFVQALDQLKKLKEDVVIKKERTIAMGEQIRDKVRSLVDTGSIKIDEDEFSKSDVSVHQYTKVLDDITAEIDRDISFYVSILQKNIGDTFSVIGSLEEEFPELITERTKFIKKYIKDVSKDLAVSFSRFCFGFQSQMKRVEYVEFIVTRSPKMNRQELSS